jgi:multidrug transporter EmrE-like cation transporter
MWRGRVPCNATLFVLYMLASSLGLITLKGALGRLSGMPRLSPLSPALLQLLVGFILYAASFIVWVRILAKLQLSTAYPVAIGLTLAGSTIGSVVLLGEKLNAFNVLGILLIFGGMVTLTLTEN